MSVEIRTSDASRVRIWTDTSASQAAAAALIDTRKLEAPAWHKFRDRPAFSDATRQRKRHNRNH